MKRFPPTTLVINDDFEECLLMERVFRGQLGNGVTHFVSNGSEGIVYLMGEGKYSNRTAFPYPSMILTDLKMAEGDGFTLLEHLKTNPAWAVIPTIVLSSSDDADDVRTAYALGASSYHLKPNNFGELRLQLEVLYNYSMTSQIPEVDASGKQMCTLSQGRIGARFPQASPASQNRVIH